MFVFLNSSLWKNLNLFKNCTVNFHIPLTQLLPTGLFYLYLSVVLLLALCVFLLPLHRVACGISVAQTEVEPRTSVGKVWSPNHWTTREFLLCSVNSRRMGFPSRVEISFSMLSSPFVRFISHVIVKQTSDITSFYLYFNTFVFLKGKSKWTREIV